MKVEEIKTIGIVGGGTMGFGIAINFALWEYQVIVQDLTEEILARCGSFKEMAQQPHNKLSEIKGLGAVKIHRIAAALEIARRMVHQSISEET